MSGQHSTPKKSWGMKWLWGWFAAAVAAVIGLATLTNALKDIADGVSNIKEGTEKLYAAFFHPEADLTLRDVKAVSKDSVRSRNVEVSIEALASKKPLTGCVAHLDAGRSSGYYRWFDGDGNEVKFDVGMDGLVIAKFVLPQLEVPSSATLRIRCDKQASTWVAVDMKNVANKSN